MAGQLGASERLQTLLTACFCLSDTQTLGQAADAVADAACALTGADGAHVIAPEQLGGQDWSNANEVRTTARRRTLVFDVARELPDLAVCLRDGQDLFVADALADGVRRPLRLRFTMSSLLFVPLQDVGLLVLWWHERLEEPPLLRDDDRSFLAMAAQVLRRRLEATELRDLSLTDPLTRLGNRRALLQALGELREGGALLLLDLDNFKQVNDTLGHRQGDVVLQTFAALLSESAPDGASVARYGGEEFAVVLPHNGRDAGAHTFTLLRRAWLTEGMAFSGGLAEHRDGATVDETLEAADRALYRAKATGRDKLVLAADVAWTDDTPAPPVQWRRRTPASSATGLDLPDLEQALREGLVHPHYQPIVSTETGLVVGVEALARLTHPRTGVLLAPGDFLPLAERTGRVSELDWQIGSTAIADVARWRDGLPHSPLSVAINVSVDHLEDASLPENLLAHCAKHRLPPEALVVEITETLRSIIGRGHEDVVQVLRDAGVGVTLDDFGTGFSSLSYLLRFPVAGIKIDRSFTAQLDTARGRTVIASMLELGNALGLHVVAEGVETRAQLDWLTAHHVHFAQGYLLSRPVPAHELPAVVAHLNSQRDHQPPGPTTARTGPERRTPGPGLGCD